MLSKITHALKKAIDLIQKADTEVHGLRLVARLSKQLSVPLPDGTDVEYHTQAG